MQRLKPQQNWWLTKYLEKNILGNKILTQLQTHISIDSVNADPLLSNVHSDVPPFSSFLHWSPCQSFSLMEESHSQWSWGSNMESGKEKRWNEEKKKQDNNALLSWFLFSLVCLCWPHSCWCPQRCRVSGASCTHLPGCHQRYTVTDRKWILLSPNTWACACFVL